MRNETELAGPAPSAAMPGRMKIPAPIIVPPPSVIASRKPMLRSSCPSLIDSPSKRVGLNLPIEYRQDVTRR